MHQHNFWLYIVQKCLITQAELHVKLIKCYDVSISYKMLQLSAVLMHHLQAFYPQHV